MVSLLRPVLSPTPAYHLAVAGALGGKFSDIGIDDSFIKEVGDQIDPGESALFMLVSDVQRE